MLYKITHTQIFRDVFGMKRTPICKFPAVKARDASMYMDNGFMVFIRSSYNLSVAKIRILF